MEEGKKFGTAPVFFTAISTILGAILFLRFGYAVGNLGFVGALMVIILGHIVTIPTALAISELATNKKVEGGGEYFIISRSFGLNIGATIGIALYFSQAISVAFYVIAFTEAFEPFFNWVHATYGIHLPRQAISVPAMLILSAIILTKGANLGVKALYVVCGILFTSLALFFLGKTGYAEGSSFSPMKHAFGGPDDFFTVFAIIFPAFTGMTAGVGLSGDLKKPGKAIPRGTVAATLFGLLFYVAVCWKLSVSASPEELQNNQLVMADIALYGQWIIPLGLAASTISSAIGSILVAPRTLQALGGDQSFPGRRINRLLSKSKESTNEPINATLITCLIALVFVSVGNVNAVAQIISMFFMVTYGSLCLISFLYHFGSDPSYRPSFRSRWYFSLTGFLLALWLIFRMNAPYALLAFLLIVLLYYGISHIHRERQGLEAIFRGAIFQVNRSLQVYLQKSKSATKEAWRPSVICVSRYTFERDTAFRLLSWISHKYGFGTYIHLIEDYYSRESYETSLLTLERLIEKTSLTKSQVFVDTIISPSYTSAVAQVIQLPGISGKENNTIIFEYDRANPDNLEEIIENYALIKAGNYDICILGSAKEEIAFKHGIHIWIKSSDAENANLMILLGYIILAHPDWKKSSIKIFNVCREDEMEENRQALKDLLERGRLAIPTKNIEVIARKEEVKTVSLISEHSSGAALTLIGFRSEEIKHREKEVFTSLDIPGNILFVNASKSKEIT